MIRAAGMVLVSALATPQARADLPSPLFCITTEVCLSADACRPHRHAPPFVLRQTEGEWTMVYAPRGNDVWLIVAETVESALATAPEGARVTAITAGTTSDGRFILHEHLLQEDGVSTRFARHWCETSDGASS
ncbi:hypothetical protein KUL25_04625 [Rhodobacteraceae bacterium N5(2021)]|uniref:Uncharacterized protein n=1 Tax=Gymnodinialimonas phycosphaerae TaxID=2841589 RepID=A0A975YGY1_9RHOB|nr:hypothetical protein [Gymnodinialimonas phycosphaerae]MBY4892044.1 hypothetical protein [Gymnodinialimonas phycosphaerae]